VEDLLASIRPLSFRYPLSWLKTMTCIQESLCVLYATSRPSSNHCMFFDRMLKIHKADVTGGGNSYRAPVTFPLRRKPSISPKLISSFPLNPPSDYKILKLSLSNYVKTKQDPNRPLPRTPGGSAPILRFPLPVCSSSPTSLTSNSIIQFFSCVHGKFCADYFSSSGVQGFFPILCSLCARF